MISRPAVRKWVLLLLCCTFWSCKSSAPVTHLTGEVTGTEKVLVLPFQNLAWLHGENESVRCPLTGKAFMTGPISEEADRLLTDLLISALNEYTAFETVPSREAPAVLEALDSPGEARRDPLKSLARTGRVLNADFVLRGYVYRFIDRVGKDYSAESPASIAFDLHLIDCVEETVVWSAYFDETQQALADDLRYIGTFFRRGARWITAEEMARDAMNGMFKEFKRP